MTLKDKLKGIDERMEERVATAALGGNNFFNDLQSDKYHNSFDGDPTESFLRRV